MVRGSYILIIISGIFYGAIAPGAQLFLDRSLTALDVSLFRALFVALLCLPLFLIKPNHFLTKRGAPFFAIYGLIGAMLEIFMFSSLALGIPIALVAFFLYSQPVWTIVFGKFLLSEKITKNKVIAVIIGLFGIAILVRSWEIESTKSFWGIILALLSGIMLSFWVIWGRKSAIYKQHYFTTTFGLAFFSAVWIFIFYLIGKSLITLENETIKISYDLIAIYWKEFALFAFVAGVLPHLLFYKGLEETNASVAGIILLAEPLTATILAALMFSQKIGFELLIGGSLIIISNIIVIRSD